MKTGSITEGKAVQRRLTLAACCGFHGLQDGFGIIVYVLLPVLADAFGLSYAQVGTIRAAKSAAMTLLEMPSGILSERFGERLLLGLGLLLVGLSFIMLATANGYLVVLLCLFIAGVGAAFQHTLSSSLIARAYTGPARRAALGTYNSAGDVGKLAFSGLFTLLAGIGFAWQGVVAGLGGIAIVASALLVLALHHAQAGNQPTIASKSKLEQSQTGWGIHNPVAFSSLVLIVLVDIAVQGGFLTFIAFLMIEKQVPVSLGALAVVLVLAGGVFGKFTCGHLAARLGIIRALILVECLTAIGIVAILLLPPMAAYFMLPVLGAVLQGSSSITYGSVAELMHEDKHARGFGLIYSVSGLAVIVAPVGFGLIADRFGLDVTMLTMACIVLLPLPLCLLLRRGLGSQAI